MKNFTHVSSDALGFFCLSVLRVCEQQRLKGAYTVATA